jgi:hypothetical protein
MPPVDPVKYKRTKGPKNCLKCNKVFEPVHHLSLYCDECSDARSRLPIDPRLHTKLPPTIKQCIECSKPYESNFRASKFCSVYCKRRQSRRVTRYRKHMDELISSAIQQPKQPAHKGGKIWKPNPGPQEFALRLPNSTFEILYGGARGG